MARQPEKDKTARGLRSDARRNREKIFAAAKKCFADSPENASMEVIAKKAGVGVGSLYRAYGSRSGLAEAIFRDTMDELTQEATRLAPSDDPALALNQWLSKYVQRIATKRTMLSELQPLFENDPDLVKRSRAAMVDALTAILRPAQKSGAVRNDIDAADLIALVSGTLSSGASVRRSLQRLAVIVDGMMLGRKP